MERSGGNDLLLSQGLEIGAEGAHPTVKELRQILQGQQASLLEGFLGQASQTVLSEQGHPTLATRLTIGLTRIQGEPHELLSGLAQGDVGSYRSVDDHELNLARLGVGAGLE